MSNAIKCDYCATYQDRPSTSGYARRTPDGWESLDKPDGWVTLQAMRSPYDRAVVADCMGEFCSWRCAGDWFDNYAKKASEAVGHAGLVLPPDSDEGQA